MQKRVKVVSEPSMSTRVTRAESGTWRAVSMVLETSRQVL